MRILVAAFLCLVPSCAFGPSPYVVSIDAIAAPGGSGSNTNFLVPGSSEMSADDLHFQEFSSYLHRALQDRGYTAAATVTDADVSIELSYRVDGPYTKMESFSRPIYGRTGTGHRYEPIPHHKRKSGDRTGYFRSSSFGVIGYSNELRTITNYLQVAKIAAYEQGAANSSASPVNLWSVEMEMYREQNDLREGFPVMLAAALPYLGINSSRKVTLELQADDPAIRKLTD